MEFDNIDISKYLIKLEDTGCALTNVVNVSLQLADEIKNILKTKEQLDIKDGQFPILETNPTRSAEIWMWAISILSSAWTEWCFTAKTNNPKYQNDPNHPEAAKNVKIALPYIITSIIDALDKAHEIGSRITNDDRTAYRPESGPAWIQLHKIS